MTNPVAVDFLKSLTYKFGLDPKQQIDMNDPMTRLVMAISIATTEQGENIYSYDQYIKGCAESAGIDPAVFDSEVNPTSLGIENNNPSTGTNASSAGGSAGGGGGNTSGYVSPKLPKIVAGGSSLPTTLISQYAAAGTAAIIATPAFQNVFGGIALNTISFKDGGLVVENPVNAVSNSIAASVTNAQGVITSTVAGATAAIGSAINNYTGPTIPINSDAIGQRVAAFTATLESGGLQNQSDVYQSMLNRSAQGYSGGDLLNVVTAREQYSPMSAALYGTTSGGAGAYSGLGISKAELTQLASQDNWASALQTRFGAGNAASAQTIVNDYNAGGTLSQNSASFVGGRTDFRGTTVTTYAGISRGGGGANTFGNVNASGKVGSITGTSVGATDQTPITNISNLGLPSGETYTRAGYTAETTTDAGYTTYKDSKGNEFYRYSDGSVYNSKDQLITTPTGVPATYNQPTLNADGSYTYTDPSTGKSFTQSADLKTIKDPNGDPINSGLYKIDPETGILTPAGATTGGPAVLSSADAINNSNIDSVTAGVNIRSGAGYGDMYTGTGTFGIGGASMMSENSSGIVVPANTGAPAAWSTGALTPQDNIANQVNAQNELYTNNQNQLDSLQNTKSTLEGYIANTSDPSLVPGWQAQLDTTNSSITNLQGQNATLEGLINNSTNQFDSMTPYNPPNTMPDNAYAEFNTPASMYNTPLSPATTGFSTDTAANVPTPDTGVVNSSNITPGSQAQTNAANAAAGGMGAPGC